MKDDNLFIDSSTNEGSTASDLDFNHDF